MSITSYPITILLLMKTTDGCSREFSSSLILLKCRLVNKPAEKTVLPRTCGALKLPRALFPVFHITPTHTAK
jgi:hypothetical protein